MYGSYIKAKLDFFLKRLTHDFGLKLSIFSELIKFVCLSFSSPGGLIDLHSIYFNSKASSDFGAGITRMHVRGYNLPAK